MGAQHGITVRQHHDGQRVFAHSSWSVPAGRLRRDCGRESELKSAADVLRWAQKYPDVPKQDVERALAVFAAPGKNTRAEPSAPLRLVRMGEVDPDGCYFSIEGGGSTYGDSATNGTGRRYRLAGARVADTRDTEIGRQLVEETLKDQRLNQDERKRLQNVLQGVQEGGGISYLDFDELPMSDAARRLGFDAVRVVENDDLPGDATSVFVMSTGLVKSRQSVRP